MGDRVMRDEDAVKISTVRIFMKALLLFDFYGEKI
jgi:hypothetical protein